MKKIILLLMLAMFLLLPSVVADYWEADETFGLNWNPAQDAYYGIVLNLTENITIYNITMKTTSTTFVQVWENGTTAGGFGAKQITNGSCGSFGGVGLCNFSSHANLSTLNPNYVIAWTGLAGWTEYYNNAASFPYPDTVGSVVTSYNDGVGGFRYDEAYDFYNLTFENWTAPAPTISANFSIIGKTLYNHSNITNFNATIDGVTYTTTNGTLVTGILQNDTTFYDINITAPDFFNKTYLSTNVSSDLTVYLVQAIISINPYDLDSTLLTLPFTLVTLNYTNDTNVLYLDAGSIPITFSKAGYHNKTETKTITARMNTTLNITDIFQSVLNITATDKTGTAINGFSLTLNSSSYQSVVNTTNGSAIFQVMNANYNATINNLSYELKTAQVNITADYTYNFSLYATNSINFTFRDEETRNIITGISVSYDLIGGVNYTNRTTTTGTAFLSLLYPSDYTVRYSSADYPERFYYFTLTNRTFEALTLYLLNATSTSNISITVYDEVSHFVENATVKALKYDITTNSYLLTDMTRTNFEGAGVLRLVKNTEFYKFVIDYEGDTKLTTTPTYIYGDTLTFQIVLTSPIGEDFYNTEEVDWTLSFNNVTNNFRFFYNDPNNVIEQGCLYLYTIDLVTDETLYNSSCVASTTSTILLGIPATNGTTYRAKAYIVFSDRTYLLGSIIKSFSGTFVSNQMGIFVIALLTMLLLMIGYWNPSIAVILTPLPLLFGSLIHLVNIHFAYIIPLEILAIIIAVIISKRS